MIAKLLARDGHFCWLCNRRMKDGQATIEHLTPRSDGGGDDLSNLVMCHAACNRHLANRPLNRKKQIRAKWHGAEAKRNADAIASNCAGQTVIPQTPAQRLACDAQICAP